MITSYGQYRFIRYDIRNNAYVSIGWTSNFREAWALLQLQKRDYILNVTVCALKILILDDWFWQTELTDSVKTRLRYLGKPLWFALWTPAPRMFSSISLKAKKSIVISSSFRTVSALYKLSCWSTCFFIFNTYDQMFLKFYYFSFRFILFVNSVRAL